MKSKSLILLVVSGVFGLVAAVMISQVIGKGGSTGPEISMGPVLVASSQLDHNALLTEENVTIENWPTDIIPENAARSFEEIEDMAIGTRLSSGLPILLGDLIDKNERNVVTVPEGFKVVSLKATSEDTMDGLLEPSDRVDVIGIFRVRKRDQLVTTAKTFLKDIVVFAIDSRMRRATDGSTGGGGGSIVSLLLNEAQAEQFILVEKEATLKLVFRSKDMGQELDPNQELVDLSDVFNPGGSEPQVQEASQASGNPYQTPPL
ncbi:MAG: Flp pilus assembly protein CpaB [Planctomycetota bacterium]